MNPTKLTKQGVRDLNHLPSRSLGVKREPPPVQRQTPHCDHFYCEGKCRDCGQLMRDLDDVYP